MRDEVLYSIKLFRNKTSQSQLVWGNYEAFKIKETEKAKKILIGYEDDDLLEDSRSAYYFLYSTHKSITDEQRNYRIVLNKNDSIFGLETKTTNHSKWKEEKRKFVCLTFFTCRAEALRDVNSSLTSESEGLLTAAIIDDINEKIGEDRDISELNISYELFGTLGTHDLCAVSFSDKISDIIKFLEKIQKFKRDDVEGLESLEYFKTSFSLLSFGYKDEEYGDNFFDEKDVYADIQLTYQCQHEWEDVLKYIVESLSIDGNNEKEIRILSSLGEYDIVIHTPINRLKTTLYQQEGLFHPESEVYNKYFYQCNTRFSLSKEDVLINVLKNLSQIPNSPNGSIDECGCSDDPDSCKKGNQKDISEDIANNKVKELRLLDQTNSFKYINSLFVNDYYNIKKLDVPLWKDDVTYQFITIAESIQKSSGDQIYGGELINELVTVFSQTVNHVVQSSHFYLEPLVSNFKATVSYDKIFRFYYGIIKGILLLIYVNGNKNQSELVPAITVDPVIIPKSTIYFDKNYDSNIDDTKSDEGVEAEEKKLLAISLPMDLWANIPYYSRLLVHEIAHYVCPCDREVRNKKFLTIILSEMISYMLLKDIDKQLVINYVINYVANTEKYNSSMGELRGAQWKEFYAAVKDSLKSFLVDDFGKNFADSSIIGIKNYLMDIYSGFKDYYIKNLASGSKEAYRKLTGIEAINFFENIEKIIVGIRESIADKYMASLTNMPLDSYLAHIIVAKLKKRVYTDDSSVTCVRIGIVFDHLNPKFSEEVRRVVKRDVDVSKDCIKDSFKKLSIRNKVFSITKKMCVGVVDTEQVERCFDDILKSYTAYINTFRIYSRYFKSILDDAEVSAKTANVDAISNIEIKNYALKTSEHFKSIRNYECDDNIKEYPKSELIKAVNTFLVQPSLVEIREQKKKCKVDTDVNRRKSYNFSTCYGYGKNEIQYPYSATSVMRSIPHFNELLLYAKKLLCDDEKDTLWFRGQAVCSWNLSPALFRGKGENIQKNYVQAYELFRADSYGAVELFGGIQTEADWISYMQHYFVPTNFMDWTEQPLTSLYFILENYFKDFCRFHKDPIIRECRSENKKNRLEQDSVLYVLNPERMNEALGHTSVIPNLSIPENAKKYNHYLIPSLDKNDYDSIGEEMPVYNGGKIKDKLNPIAIITSQLSNRIKAQRGHFVAFNTNVFVPDSMSKVKLQEVFDLEKIQQSIYDKNQEEFKPFLHKIIIPLKCKEDLSVFVGEMGISLARIYPELHNIGEEIASKFN